MLKKIPAMLAKTVKIMRFARPFWHFYLFTIALSLVSSLFALIQPWLMMFFLDDVLINKKFDLFPLVLAGFLLIYVLSQGLAILSNLFNTNLSQKQQLYIKTAVYEHLQQLHLNFFHKKKVGDLLNRIDYDIPAIQSFINTITQTVFISLVNFVIIIYVSLTLNLEVTLLALTVFPFYILSERFWVTQLRKNTEQLRIKSSDLFSFLQESLSAIKVTKSFAQEQEMSRKYTNKMKSYNRLGYKNVLDTDKAGLVNNLILYLPTFVVLAAGGYQVLLGALTVGGLIALQQYIGRLFGPIMSFVGLNRTLQMEMVSINRVFEILQTKPEVRDKPGAREVKEIKGRIEFKDILFRHKKKQPLLEGITATIKPGEHIGLVGSSGVGKSTLMNLLFRFYEPQKGNILLDGTDLQDIKIKSLRSRIGFVSQESILFNRSIKENIAFGRPHAKMKDIAEAARIAGIHDFIAQLPQKYDTVVGERGEMLSGGQRQRLSIARVVLENPDIIILDEPTSYLDSETEERVKNALDYITKAKTTIVIAHRLATLKNIDEIWVLEDGRIAEKGSFDQLLEKKGKFFQYYIQQFGGFDIFRNRLKSEVERAKKFQKPLSLIQVDVHDWFKYVADPIAGNELSSHILLELAKNLEDMYFASDLPQRKGTFLVALPETAGKEAEKVKASVKALLSRKFRDLTISLKLAFSSTFVAEPEKITADTILKDLPG